VVVQAGQEAADPADAHAECEGEHERIAGGEADAQDALGHLDAGPPAEQAADDRLAAEDRAQVAGPPRRQVVGPRLGPRQQLRPHQRPADRADQQPQVPLDRHARPRPPLPQEQVQPEPAGVADQLHHRVGVDRQAEHV
jgi:hypothetical protein